METAKFKAIFGFTLSRFRSKISAFAFISLDILAFNIPNFVIRVYLFFFAIVADSIDGATLHSFLAECDLFGGNRLFFYEGVAFGRRTKKIRCQSATNIEIDTLVIDVKLSLNIFFNPIFRISHGPIGLKNMTFVNLENTN
jgi:hypothetical protein